MLRIPHLAAMLLAVLSLAGGSGSAQDIVSEGNWITDTCSACGDGIGGWNLYWYDPTECNSPCHCRNGDQICPGASSPRFYGGVEFLPLFRDQLSPAIFAARAAITTSTTTTTTSGAPAVTTTTTSLAYTKRAELTEDDFSNAFDPGMRLSLGVALNDVLRIEGSYVGNYHWSGAADANFLGSAGASNASVGNLLSPFSHFGNPYGDPSMGTFSTATITKTGGVVSTEVTGVPLAPIAGLDYGSSVHVNYSSQLSMGELNLRRRLSNISTSRVAAEASVLVGFRQLTLSETFGYSANSNWPDLTNPAGAVVVPAGSATNSVGVITNNRLYGPQIGAQTQFLAGPRTWIDFDLKGAILFGTANGTVDSTFLGGTANEASAFYTNSENITAFLGELSLKYNYQLTRCVTLNAGYNSFFLSGVALASKNLDHDVATLLGGSVQPDHSGRIVYHGPSIGLIWAR